MNKRLFYPLIEAVGGFSSFTLSILSSFLPFPLVFLLDSAVMICSSVCSVGSGASSLTSVWLVYLTDAALCLLISESEVMGSTIIPSIKFVDLLAVVCVISGFYSILCSSLL